MGFVLSAFADEACPELSGQVRALEEEGIRLIELRGVDGKSCADLTDDEAKRCRAMLDDHGIALSALGSPYGKIPVTSPFGPHLDAFRRGLDLCGMLGARRVRMFSFYMPKGEAPGAYRGEVLDRIDAMLRAAEGTGVECVHENEKGIYGDDTQRCEDLAKAFEGRMPLVFDPANFIQCGVKPLEAFPRLKKYLRYFHVKDALLSDGSVVPAGMGDGCVPEILSRLEPEGDMVLTVEPHLAVFDGLKALQDEELRGRKAYASSREAFAAAVSALKGILTDIGYTERSGIWTR